MDYGKFTSLDELVKGYNQLEKSFTQKCQQLAESERQNRTLSEQLAQLDKSNTELVETKAATAPIAQECALTDEPKEICQTATIGTNGQPSPKDSEVGTAHSTTVESVETVPQDTVADAVPVSSDLAPAEKTPSEAELQQYLLQNPEFAQKLLQNTKTEFAPVVMGGGGNVPLAPPSRPKSIKEASLMAKDLFSLN